MAEQFKWDVFLSYSSKDKKIVRDIADRLKSDGLKVWFDEDQLKPGDSIPSKIEEGLENSRTLVLCMSANLFGSDWSRLESYTLRFRDPLNKDRRFIPLQLYDAPVPTPLAQSMCIDWQSSNREREYPKLRSACRPPAVESCDDAAEKLEALRNDLERSVQLEGNKPVYAYAFHLDGKEVLTAGPDSHLRLWDTDTGHCLRLFYGHTDLVQSVSLCADQRRVASGSRDATVRLWDVETGRCLQVLAGHTDWVRKVAWSNDGRHVISGGNDHTVRLWDVETGRSSRIFEGHTGNIWALAWSDDQRFVLTGAFDHTVRVWDAETGQCLRVLDGHHMLIRNVAWSNDQCRALSSSDDHTLRLWDVETGRCLRVLEGHTAEVWTLAWHPQQDLALSGSDDNTLRLWDLKSGRCLRVLQGSSKMVRAVAWGTDGRHAFSGDQEGRIAVWDVSELVVDAQRPQAAGRALSTPTDQIQYTNAKVLLVGESSSGKTGLSTRLALNKWEPSDSTVGAWATQWKLPISSGDGVEREIWLWDFGGQADQRLIHQLYMEDTALAVLVFDGQKDNLLQMLGQWDRDLTRASRKPFTKVLVAGRADAGGLRAASRRQVEAFARARGYISFLETSAKTGEHCDELKQAILDGIRWADIPWRSSPLLFKRLRTEIIRLKDRGHVLMRFNELRENLRLLLSGQASEFADGELRAVLGLLAGPGVAWELSFGGWILLQPERINAYAQAVIQTIREDEHERGCLPEERVLKGDLTYHSSIARLKGEEERFVLLAMHQTLVERGLCLREQTDTGAVLVFPSYYRRERPELVGHPAVLVSYRFNGFLDDIYATLIVRLHRRK